MNKIKQNEIIKILPANTAFVKPIIQKRYHEYHFNGKLRIKCNPKYSIGHNIASSIIYVITFSLLFYFSTPNTRRATMCQHNMLRRVRYPDAAKLLEHEQNSSQSALVLEGLPMLYGMTYYFRA